MLNWRLLVLACSQAVTGLVTMSCLNIVTIPVLNTSLTRASDIRGARGGGGGGAGGMFGTFCGTEHLERIFFLNNIKKIVCITNTGQFLTVSWKTQLIMQFYVCSSHK